MISTSPPFFRRGEVPAHCRGLVVQALRRLVAAEQQARLASIRAGEEVQPQRGLAGTGRAYQSRDGGFGDAAAEHAIERGDTGRHARPRRRLTARRHGEQGLDSREDDDAVPGDAERVLAFQEVAAAHLADQKPALGTGAHGVLTQLDDPVHHRVFRRVHHAHDAGQQEHGAVGRGGQGLQRVSEPLRREPSPALFGPDSAHAVKHQEIRLVGQHLPANEGQQARKPVVLKRPADVGVGYLLGDAAFIEELHRTQMEHHPTMVLAKHADEQRPATIGGACIDDLARQDRLAEAGRSLDHVQAATQEAAAQDRIKPRHAGADAADLPAVLACHGLRSHHASFDPGLGVQGEA